MTFAAITPCLIVGAFAERAKFSAVIVFAALWVTFVYFPIAHMVWFWGGPSAADAPTGLIFGFGAIDFAGGTVVHINSGIAGLVGALMIGKRIGYMKDIMAPNSMTLTMVGASLLWVGWFGFNAGSNLEANYYAVLADGQHLRCHRCRCRRLGHRRGDRARQRPRCSVRSPARSPDWSP